MRARAARASGWRFRGGCSTRMRILAAFGPGLVAWLPGARPGFSGGPLLDAGGRLVGMVTALRPAANDLRLAAGGGGGRGGPRSRPSPCGRTRCGRRSGASSRPGAEGASPALGSGVRWGREVPHVRSPASRFPACPRGSSSARARSPRPGRRSTRSRPIAPWDGLRGGTRGRVDHRAREAAGAMDGRRSVADHQGPACTRWRCGSGRRWRWAISAWWRHSPPEIATEAPYWNPRAVERGGIPRFAGRGLGGRSAGMSLAGREIAVIGAGIGGLAAATALARRGARVVVFEQAGALAEVGAGAADLAERRGGASGPRLRGGGGGACGLARGGGAARAPRRATGCGPGVRP